MGTPAVRPRGVPPAAGPIAVARVLALVPDLLFGSRLQGALRATGDELELVADGARVVELLSAGEPRPPEVLIVDLTDGELNGAGLVETLAGRGALARTRTLGFYSHVDVATRGRAERAGFDLVVPRSRMAREAGELVARLAGAAAPALD